MSRYTNPEEGSVVYRGTVEYYLRSDEVLKVYSKPYSTPAPAKSAVTKCINESNGQYYYGNGMFNAIPNGATVIGGYVEKTTEWERL